MIVSAACVGLLVLSVNYIYGNSSERKTDILTTPTNTKPIADSPSATQTPTPPPTTPVPPTMTPSPATTTPVATIQNPSPTPTAIPTIPPTAIPTAGYICNCDKTCSQITTCTEAYYQLNTCGCSKRDNDGDGIPCEELCQ